MPELTGNPIFISAKPQLTASRGKLLSRQPQRGKAVHAGSFIRRRKIVLETELLTKHELPLILVHELFHFVWARLGNAKRASYADLLRIERQAGAHGELGESSAVQKEANCEARDYACESFCDTAAWLYGQTAPNRHATLAFRWRKARQSWFETHLTGPIAC